MCASKRRTKWILGNVQNNYRNMTDYVDRQVECSTPSDPRLRRPDGQKFDDDVAQKEGGGWLSENALQVTEGHSNWYHSKAWVQFRIRFP